MGEKDIESKLGKPIYSFTLYEKKIKRATFLLDNEDYPFLMVSLDKQVGRGASVQEEEAVATVDDECVTLNKILSIVKQQIQFD